MLSDLGNICYEIVLSFFQSLIGNNENSWGWDLGRNKVTFDILFNYFNNFDHTVRYGFRVPTRNGREIDPTIFMLGALYIGHTQSHEESVKNCSRMKSVLAPFYHLAVSK